MSTIEGAELKLETPDDKGEPSPVNNPKELSVAQDSTRTPIPPKPNATAWRRAFILLSRYRKEHIAGQYGLLNTLLAFALPALVGGGGVVVFCNRPHKIQMSDIQLLEHGELDVSPFTELVPRASSSYNLQLGQKVVVVALAFTASEFKKSKETISVKAEAWVNGKGPKPISTYSSTDDWKSKQLVVSISGSVPTFFNALGPEITNGERLPWIVLLPIEPVMAKAPEGSSTLGSPQTIKIRVTDDGGQYAEKTSQIYFEVK